MIRGRTHAEPQENQDRWLLTYADMITLLTIFFLLLYSMSVMNRNKFTAVASAFRTSFNANKEVYESAPGVLLGATSGSSRALVENSTQNMSNLRQYVEENKMRDRVRVQYDSRGVVISLLADDMLFARGSAEVQPSSQAILGKIAGVLKSVSNTVQIEGHTCDLAVKTPLYPSNWELSSARAGAVVRTLAERFGLAPSRFQATGFADSKPIVPNISEENRAKNRRVDIVILKTQEQQEADWIRRAEIQRILASPSS
jgi:chemotaxis protein MotB